MNVTPTPIPGSENLMQVLGWVSWAGMAALLVFFMIGIVKAGQSRRQNAEERLEAPVWPLIAAGFLGMAGTIFSFFM